MLNEAFPSELEKDLNHVLKIFPNEAINGTLIFTNDTITYKHNNHIIKIPYRIYLIDINDDIYNTLNPTQQQIVCCIFTRHADGYIREKYLRRLFNMEFQSWTIPFIVKLCDEYVLEIIEIIYDKLKDQNNTDIKNFVIENKDTINRSYDRMVSYWNEFYRTREYHFHRYVGRKLFRECLGYNRTFSKKRG